MDHSLYFYRTAVYSEDNGKVALANINNPSQVTPLEPWFAMIIPLADGQHTLNELMQHLNLRYNGKPPHNLEETIDSVIERLIEGKLLVTSSEKTKLPYYLSLPIEELDIEKAKKLMMEDRLMTN